MKYPNSFSFTDRCYEDRSFTTKILNSEFDFENALASMDKKTLQAPARIVHDMGVEADSTDIAEILRDWHTAVLQLTRKNQLRIVEAIEHATLIAGPEEKENFNWLSFAAAAVVMRAARSKIEDLVSAEDPFMKKMLGDDDWFIRCSILYLIDKLDFDTVESAVLDTKALLFAVTMRDETTFEEDAGFDEGAED